VPSSSPATPDPRPSPVREVAAVFFKLGVIGFGGPAAHVAMMEQEVVERREWLDREHFLDIVGLTNLIPGPNSTEMAIHLGYLRAGWRGLFVGGLCFLAPAIALTTLIAASYTHLDLARFTAGIKPAVLAVILGAGWKLGRAAVKRPPHIVLAAAVAGAVLLGVPELWALLGGALAGTLAFARPRRANAVDLLTLFLVFLKVGSILYGSGYVLVAFLQTDLVEHHGWLTDAGLLDAIAIGQFTPGPVLSTATFIGYQVAGGAGAVLATLGIFAPSFVFVALLGPLVARLRASPWAAAFLEAVRVSAVALLAAVVLVLGRAVLVDGASIAIAVVACVAVLRFRIGAAWIVAGGVVLGWIL
jgi:chromate transporter